MWDLVQVTVQYSQAVLLAILPFVSDFSKRLDLPIPLPITTNQVSEFKCDPRMGQTGGALTLANGCQFTFLEGRVTLYRSPKSYFSLQDPDLIPQLYGPVKLTKQESLTIALGVIDKLGYERSVFNATNPPLVTLPDKIGTHSIPRYRIRWLDPNFPALDNGTVVPALLDIEINAENGAVEMVVINSRDTRRPSPKVGVVPRLLHPRPPVESPGTPTKPTSAAYAEAFLGAILPQISEFVVKIGLTNSVGAISNRSAVTNYLCRILEGQPIAQLFLTNGDRFNFEHGHVEAFYAHDAMEKFPEGGNPADFLGHIHLTTDEAISLCARVMRAMGYTNALPVPTISYALARGTLVCARYHYFWAHPGEDLPFASFEVDMETKSIKSAFLKDSPFARESPKINVPMEAEEGK